MPLAQSEGSSLTPSRLENPLYSPLEADAIRVVEICPGKDHEQINCNLCHVFGIGREGLSYEALSYTWGPPEPTQFISINGQQVSVRHNLFNALKALRESNCERVLWVDALCINQDDIPERNSQVLQMARIYREAERVLIWLGEEHSENVNSFYFLLGLRKGKEDLVLLDDDLRNPLCERMVGAILELTSRPYWKRVWIVQEVLSACQLSIVCGTKTVNYSDFTDAFDILDTILYKHKHLDDELPWKSKGRTTYRNSAAFQILRVYNEGSPDEPYSFEDLLYLRRTCGSECQDRHDRIYGLLGLLSDFKQANITPDYTKTFFQLYVDALLVHLSVETIDQVPATRFPYRDLLAFASIVNMELNYPRWPLFPGDNQFYESLEVTCPQSQLQKMFKTINHVSIQVLSIITNVGPIVSKFSRWTSSLILPISKENASDHTSQDLKLLGKVSKPDTYDFHCTRSLGARYKQVSSDIYTPTYLYPCPMSEERPKNLPNIDARSSGNCQVFLTANGFLGLASCDIQQGDWLCSISEIDNLIFVAHPEEDALCFTIIGKAVPLVPGSEDAASSTRRVSDISDTRIESKF